MNNVWYNAAKAYFPRFYDEEDVKIFVLAGKITEEQYEEITGIPYSTNS